MKISKHQVSLAVAYVVVGFLNFGWNINHVAPDQFTCFDEQRAMYVKCEDDRAAIALGVLAGVFWPLNLAGRAALFVTRWP